MRIGSIAGSYGFGAGGSGPRSIAALPVYAGPHGSSGQRRTRRDHLAGRRRIPRQRDLPAGGLGDDAGAAPRPLSSTTAARVPGLRRNDEVPGRH